MSLVTLRDTAPHAREISTWAECARFADPLVLTIGTALKIPAERVAQAHMLAGKPLPDIATDPKLTANAWHFGPPRH